MRSILPCSSCTALVSLLPRMSKFRAYTLVLSRAQRVTLQKLTLHACGATPLSTLLLQFYQPLLELPPHTHTLLLHPKSHTRCSCSSSRSSSCSCCWCHHTPGDTFKLMHCVPSLPPGRLVAVAGAGLLRVPHVDPALLAEKAAAEADTTLAAKFKAKMQDAGVRREKELATVLYGWQLFVVLSEALLMPTDLQGLLQRQTLSKKLPTREPWPPAGSHRQR